MIKLWCQGYGCRKWVGKDDEKQNGWTVVFFYPLNEVGTGCRRLLCPSCARKFKESWMK